MKVLLKNYRHRRSKPAPAIHDIKRICRKKNLLLGSSTAEAHSSTCNSAFFLVCAMMRRQLSGQRRNDILKQSVPLCTLAL